MIRLLPFLRADQVMAMVRDTGLESRIVQGRAYLVRPGELAPPVPAFLRKQAPELQRINNWSEP